MKSQLIEDLQAVLKKHDAYISFENKAEYWQGIKLSSSYIEIGHKSAYKPEKVINDKSRLTENLLG